MPLKKKSNQVLEELVSSSYTETKARRKKQQKNLN